MAGSDDFPETLEHGIWLSRVDDLLLAGVDPYTAVTTTDPRNTPPHDTVDTRARWNR